MPLAVGESLTVHNITKHAIQLAADDGAIWTFDRETLEPSGFKTTAPPTVPILSPRELATVLAALRLWDLVDLEHDDDPENVAIMAIAEDGGKFQSLRGAEIDALCERLNCGGGKPAAFVRVHAGSEYIVPADRQDMIDAAREAVFEDVCNLIKHDELAQAVSVDPAPNATDADVPDFIKEECDDHDVETAGDDLCDLCQSSEVNVDRTTYCGKTIGIECGCEQECDGTCGNPDCEACKIGSAVN